MNKPIKTQETRAAVELGSDALLAMLLKSADIERSFGNQHADLIAAAAKEIVELKKDLAFTIRANRELGARLEEQAAMHTIDINATIRERNEAASDRDYWKRCAEKAGFIES